MINIKKDDYILGIWYAERVTLGKVYIWALKGKEENEWVGHLRYRYNNLNLTLSIDDSNPQNTFICHNTTESQMKKTCQDRFDELIILFCHNNDYLMIHGNLRKLEDKGNHKLWLPKLRENSSKKSKHYPKRY